MRIRAFSTALMLATLSGCASVAVAPPPSIPMTVPVSSGYFANEGLAITASDGSFTIRGGARFIPPFQTDLYCPTCTAQYFGVPIGVAMPVIGASTTTQVDLLDPNVIRSSGGREVFVTLPNGQRLYGLLLLNRVFGPTEVGYQAANFKFYGPSLRSYELSIPQDRIAEALTGRTSLAYEVFAEVPQQNSMTGRARTYVSWVLLMSRDPL